MLLGAILVTSSGAKSGPTTVESITIMTDDGSGGAGKAVESLKSTDLKFHMKAKCDVGDSAKLKADLIAVDTTAGKDILVLSKEYEIGGLNNTVTIDYSLPNPWPVGAYKIDVSIDGKVVKSKEFRIE